MPILYSERLCLFVFARNLREWSRLFLPLVYQSRLALASSVPQTDALLLKLQVAYTGRCGGDGLPYFMKAIPALVCLRWHTELGGSGRG